MRDVMRLVVFRVAIAKAFSPRALKLVQALTQPIQRLGFQALPHDAEAVANPGTNLGVNITGCHRPDRLAERDDHLI
jgi:hypothetical protein